MTHHVHRPLRETYPSNDLTDRDARLLLDIGLVRAADGSLRLAADPAVAAVPAAPRPGLWARLVGWLGRRRGAARQPKLYVSGCG